MNFVDAGNNIAVREYFVNRNDELFDSWVNLDDASKTRETLEQMYPTALQQLIKIFEDGNKKLFTAKKCADCEVSFVCDEHVNAHKIGTNECKNPPLSSVSLGFPKTIITVEKCEKFDVNGVPFSKCSIRENDAKLLINGNDSQRLIKCYKVNRLDNENFLSFILRQTYSDENRFALFKQIANQNLTSDHMKGENFMSLHFQNVYGQYKNTDYIENNTIIWKWFYGCLIENALMSEFVI